MDELRTSLKAAAQALQTATPQSLEHCLSHLSAAVRILETVRSGDPSPRLESGLEDLRRPMTLILALMHQALSYSQERTGQLGAGLIGYGGNGNAAAPDPGCSDRGQFF